ncbi:MAG: prolyl oligopeptidase family serine peptidase [Nocardioidaceae bacterium]
MSIPSYPETRRGDVVETRHGREIADPYRWLEDPDSPETVDWVRRQNAATEEHLASLPDRDWFTATMNAVVHRPRAGVPFRKAGRYVVSRNDGQQAQDVWYVADTLSGLRAGGEVLVDPNTFSADGTDSLGGMSFSDDGHYLAYTVSEGGSDWQNFRLRDLRTGTEVDDAPIQTKFSLPTWLPDGTSYLYVGYPRSAHAEGTQTQAVGAPRLLLHRVGTPESADTEVLAFPEDDELICWPELSHDDAWVLVSIVKGTESRNRLWAYPVSTADGRSTLGPPVTVVSEPVAEFGFLRTEHDRLWLQTDLDAPRGRIVSCPILAGDPTPELTEIVAEGASTLAAAVAVGDLLVTETLVDATPQLDRWALDGTHQGRIAVTGGAVVGIIGEPGDPEGFVGLSSVTSPTRAYALDVTSGAVEPLDDLVRPNRDAASEGDWTPPETRTVRRAATGADGTRVPYFLITRADLDLSAPRPTLLYGYGGFKISVLADYRAGWSGWLAAGGVLAIANLRGGGEFGSDWYDDGRGPAKQHVFDDFIAVAEHLAATGVTTSAQLALHGRSNGGLLVGAVMTQRPDLAAVALPGVGVLDLLRFHLFTYGRAWVSDYGNPEDAEDFAVALAYSPLHNVSAGTAYPATLVSTGDHDDRVVPLHSHKFTAALQHAQAGAAPVLTRIEVATGHGAGKPLTLVAAEWADLLAFAAHHTGLHPS